MITKEKALKQYIKAAREIRDLGDRHSGLTPEQKTVLTDAAAAKEELRQAREEFERAVGTPKETAALSRVQRAESIAPIREGRARAVRGLMVPSQDHDLHLRAATFQMKDALQSLGHFESREMLESMNLEPVLDGLRKAYAVYMETTKAPRVWGLWLVDIFPEPSPKKWPPYLQDAKRHLESRIAEDIKGMGVEL